MAKTTTLKQAKKILEIFESAPAEQVQQLLESGFLADLRDSNFRAADRPGRTEFRKICGLYDVIVDHSKSLMQMITNANYRWVHSNIDDEAFPIKDAGEKTVVVELVWFNRRMNNETALGRLRECDYRPATIEELIALGSQHLRKGDESVVALGSSYRFPGKEEDGCGVPVYSFFEDDRRPTLDLCWSGWAHESVRFAAVRMS